MRTIRLATHSHILLLALLAVLLSACVEHRFVVDHAGDQSDHNPGDGVCAALVGYESSTFPPSPVYACTLRAAIEEANALGSYVEIRVPPHPISTYEFDPIHVTGNVTLVATGEVNLAGPLHFQGGARAILLGFNHYDSPGPDSCVEVLDAQVFIFHTTFSGCQGERGGALFVGPEGTVFVETSRFRFSEANIRGGGAIFNDGFVSVRRSTFFRNESWGGIGGAIHNAESGELFLANTALHENHGGAIVNRGVATLANVSITHNEHSFTGGLSGGLTNFEPGSVVIRNTLLANNFPGDCMGTLSSEGFNVIEDDSAGACVRTDDAHLDEVGVPTDISQRWVEVYPLAEELVGVPVPGDPGYGEGNPLTPGSLPEACETYDLLGNDRRTALRCDVGAVQVSP